MTTYTVTVTCDFCKDHSFAAPPTWRAGTAHALTEASRKGWAIVKEHPYVKHMCPTCVYVSATESTKDTKTTPAKL